MRSPIRTVLALFVFVSYAGLLPVPETAALQSRRQPAKSRVSHERGATSTRMARKSPFSVIGMGNGAIASDVVTSLPASVVAVRSRTP